ncbi:MAG: phage portal protein, partial [Wenzhouxiangella sp.]
MRFIDKIKKAFTQEKSAPIQGNWQAGKSGNRAFRDYGNPGPNLANLSYLNTARSRVRDAVRNAPFAARIVDLQVTNIIGTGIVPRFTDAKLAALWLQFEDECDTDWTRDIYGLQESAVRAWQEAGECFIRIRSRRIEDGLAVPFQLELLEADMVPMHDQKLADGNEIIQGVEINKIGRKVAYYFHRKHPLDGYSGATSITELVRVPAEFVIHLYEPLRPGQLRGFPPLATALQRIQQMNDFDEATIERQKLASSLTFVITRPVPESAGIDPVTGEALGGRSASDIKPGSAYQLLPGEDIESPPLPSLGSEYEVFSKVQIRAISAGAGVPYELVNNDFSRLSDRTARVLINEYRRRVEQNQWHRVVRQMMRPIYLHFVETAILSSAVPSSVDVTVRWVPPAWPYFHPVQDVESIQ